MPIHRSEWCHSQDVWLDIPLADSLPWPQACSVSGPLDIERGPCIGVGMV